MADALLEMTEKNLGGVGIIACCNVVDNTSLLMHRAIIVISLWWKVTECNRIVLKL